MSFKLKFAKFILFAFLICVLAGLGILTIAIYGIESGQTPTTQQKQDILNYIKTKPTNTIYTKEMQDAEIKSTPTVPSSIDNGTKIIKLTETNLTISKISLITFWIIIILSLITIPIYKYFDY